MTEKARKTAGAGPWWQRSAGWPLWLVAGLGALGTGLVGLLDYVLFYQISVIFLYLVPIGFVAWFGRRRLGYALALLSGGVWLIAELMTGSSYSSPWVAEWDAAVVTAIFIVVAHLTGALREAFARLQTLADTDALTGLANRRSFLWAAGREIERTRRTGEPLSLAYLDLDDFKQVNDSRGHAEGDRLLVQVAEALSSGLRAADLAARLGGDEFALLLPDADESESATAVARVCRALDSVLAEWEPGAGYSAGVVTFRTPPASEEALLKAADHLMYEAKGAGKGQVFYRVIL